jgi:hypothetical protein
MDEITLTALAAFPAQLEAYYAALPAGCANWAPQSWQGVPSEPFTPIAQICHVRDIEIDGYSVRIRRILHESTPFLPSIDGESLARERSYATASAPEVLSAFRAARARTVESVSGLSAEQLARPGVLEGYGPVSLRSLLHYLCSHDQQHLAGLQWLLGKITSGAPRPDPTLV